MNLRVVGTSVSFQFRNEAVFRKVKEIKGLRGGVHWVRRTSDPADLRRFSRRSHEGYYGEVGDCEKGPFLDGN